MSKKSAKTDLLVRVRYLNPLPPPPFPPRLLHIDTNPQRYATYEFLNPLTTERELSLVLDSELGLPFEYAKQAQGEHQAGEYWIGGRSKIAPPPGSAPPPHDDDLFLLGDATSSSLTPGFLPSTPSGQGERKKTDVSWLRKTEYLSSEMGAKPLSLSSAFGAPKPSLKPVVELTRQSRVDAIKASFPASQSPLAELRHPMKPNLRAEESWNIFPDSSLWANSLNLVRFGEDPGEGRVPSQTPTDARLPRAIFRPVEIPNSGTRTCYYLPTDEGTAIAYEQRRRAGPEGAPEEEAFDFKYVRDYEVGNSRKLKEEYIFTFEDGGAEGEGGMEVEGQEAEARPAKRPRGVYYASLGTAQTLRKRRPRRNEDPTVFPQEAIDQGIEFWDGISLKVRGLEILEDDERDERVALEGEVDTIPNRLA